MIKIEKSINQIFFNQVQASGDKVAYNFKEKEAWQSITWKETYTLVSQIALGLYSLGFKKGDKIAILAHTKVQWIIADLAILSLGAITVPIYPTYTPEEVFYILDHSEAKAVFIENGVQYEKIREIKSTLKKLSYCLSFETYLKKKIELIDWQTLVKFGQEKSTFSPHLFQELSLDVEEDNIATIIYTSGTTAQPKGAILTHRNFISELRDVVATGIVSANDITMTFLPFSHVLGRVEYLSSIALGWETYFADNIHELTSSFLEIRPTLVWSVPRLYEKMYERITAQVEQGSFIKKKIFYWGVAIGREVSKLLQTKQPIPQWLNYKYRLANRLIFKKISQKLGGRLRFFVSGGAPLSQKIAEVFHAVGIMILEGYGLTETTAAICLNYPTKFKFGTVGVPLGEVQLKIAPDGEILIKSDKLFKGYYKDQENTERVLKDGWFATGDIGTLDNGFLKITDRKKDIIVTSTGKNIAPQEIENFLKTDRYLSQVFVYGDKRNYLTALITLNLEEISNWARQNKINFNDPQELVSHHQVENLIYNRIQERNRHLAPFETIKKFKILKEDFSIDNGTLTPTLKLKRRVCEEKYQEILDSMYKTKYF